MSYLPHSAGSQHVLAWFRGRARVMSRLTGDLEALFSQPALATARQACLTYFDQHQPGDVESLRMFTAAFADKRLVASLVDSILSDDEALRAIAARSYPHPIGFDKLVLHHDVQSGWKLRLHIYWRGNQRAEMERLHLHRFEMASAIISGELTNHTWAVTAFEDASGLVEGITERQGTSSEFAAVTPRSMAAYSGYLRDGDGVLHKSFLGRCELSRIESRTFVSGQAYAQVLDDAHYVETNAETGVSNGDICSTVYIHGASLRDTAGRSIPILFEDEELAEPDEIITPIAALGVEDLRESLTRYRGLLHESIEYYDWLYDARHGRDLSVGMIAGYLLAEQFQDPHVIKLWIAREAECKMILTDAADELARLLMLDQPVSAIDRDDRRHRYFAILAEKAQSDPLGPSEWLRHNGDLVKEMWRYCGAIKGEKPDVTVLKPVWESVVGIKMPGGAHYGHVAAMIEAAFASNELVAGKQGHLSVQVKQDGSPVTEADVEIESLIASTLASYFPDYSFFGEESGDGSPALPQVGDRRWLVDPIDGTRNFVSGGDDWCISISCQDFDGARWQTTDAVISVPATGRIYWAERGTGAWVIERDDTEHEIVMASEGAAREVNDVLAGKLVDVSIRGFGIDAEMQLLRSIRDRQGIYRSSGSAGMMLAQVADRGRDAAVITAASYDVAAGVLIATEAGAHVTTADFNRDDHVFSVLIAAADSSVHELLIAEATTALEGHGLSSWTDGPTAR